MQDALKAKSTPQSCDYHVAEKGRLHAQLYYGSVIYTHGPTIARVRMPHASSCHSGASCADVLPQLKQGKKNHMCPIEQDEEL